MYMRPCPQPLCPITYSATSPVFLKSFASALPAVEDVVVRRRSWNELDWICSSPREEDEVGVLFFEFLPLDRYPSAVPPQSSAMATRQERVSATKLVRGLDCTAARFHVIRL